MLSQNHTVNKLSLHSVQVCLAVMCSEQLAEENLCNFHSVLLHYMLIVLNMPTYTVYIDAVAHTGYARLKCSMNL